MATERLTTAQAAKLTAASDRARAVLQQEAFRCQPGAVGFPTAPELTSYVGAGYLCFYNTQGATFHGVILTKPDGWVKWLVLGTQTAAAVQPLLSAVKQITGFVRGQVWNPVIRQVLVDAGCSVDNVNWCEYQGT
jgi:hypothetical protein